MRVLVTGATGLLGRAIAARLLADGHDVLALSRSSPESSHRRTKLEGVHWLQGDPARPGPWLDEISGIDGIVHLAGESIAGGRWTSARKSRLVASRLESTWLLASTIMRAAAPPEFFVCASAVGYYGFRGEEELVEDSPPGEGFLAQLCQDWEAAAFSVRRPGTRVIALRLGVILSEAGGALDKMLPAFRLGAGGPIGPPQNYFPWIHIEDAVGIALLAMGTAREGSDAPRTGPEGPINAVAPEAVTMGEFAGTLGRVLGRPAVLPVPLGLLRLALGEGADALSPGQKVRPRRALELGYEFRAGELEAALRWCVAG